MRIALVANPKAGGAEAPEALARRLEAHGADVSRVEGRDAAALSGFERVVAAGGDGTLAPVALAAAEAGIPLAVLPTGTANDFARRFELPDELDEAARLAAAGERTRRVDVARIGARPFLNVASAGLAVPAARRAAGWKRALGPLAYAAGALVAAARAEPVACRVERDGEEVFRGRAWQAVIACSGAFGAGSRIEPSDPADGLLDVAVVAAGPRPRLARHAYGLRTGSLASQPGVVHARGATIRLELPGGAELNVDGELERPEPLDARVVATVELLVP